VGAYLIDAAIGMVVLLIAVGVFAGISFGTGGHCPCRWPWPWRT
jgi:hypothetical protein